MSTIDVSIIIPCHNGAKYLPKLAISLEPLLNSRVEVVLADDGSTDGSSRIFKQLLPQAVCLSLDKCGVGRARNQGVEVARGEFLQLLDADDTIEAGKFETQLEYARAHSLDVVYSDWRMVVVDDNQETAEPWVNAQTNVEIVEALLGGWWYSTNAALVRADSFRAVGGCDPALNSTCDDFDLWVRLGIAGYRFGYVNGNFANYYRYKKARSVSRTNPQEFNRGEAQIILNAVKLLEARSAAAAARRRAAARRLHSVARRVYAIDRAWYRRLMQDVWKLDPDFRPAGPLTYQLASRVLGLEGAEKLAAQKRRLFAR